MSLFAHRGSFVRNVGGCRDAAVMRGPNNLHYSYSVPPESRGRFQNQEAVWTITCFGFVAVLTGLLTPSPALGHC